MTMQWLEALTNAPTVIGAVGAVATGTVFVIRARAKSIAALRNALARCWTDEDGLAGHERQGVDLDLRLSEAGLVGQVTSKTAIARSRHTSMWAGGESLWWCPN
jgi:hypothetical protein